MGEKQGIFQNKSILNGKWFELKLVRFVPGARRMDRNRREYIRGTAQRPGERGQIELVYVKEQ